MVVNFLMPPPTMIRNKRILWGIFTIINFGITSFQRTMAKRCMTGQKSEDGK
jgi:hypothetical protein